VLKAMLGGSVFADVTGPARPDVLALHGWGRTRADLAPAVAERSALLVDLPGFGASPPPADTWGSADYARLLAPLLDDGQPWTVLGHSFGGRVAVQLALLRPERVAGLVLTGVPLLRSGGGGRTPAPYRLARALHERRLLSEPRMERLRQRYGSADYRAVSGVMRSTLVRVVNEDCRSVLPQLRCPVELVWGALDTAAPLAMAEEASRLLPTAELHVSPRSGHLLDAPLIGLLQDRLAVQRRTAPGPSTGC
jgi:pimeloyl-ACP methyl ester carboxylesterase